MKRGDHVRLHPSGRGDIFDLALNGQTARIDAIEDDLDGRRHVVVILDDDPGRAVGPRAPGHRFFFAPEELEFLPTNGNVAPMPTRSILIAGIGNIFLGDDGFGVEVAQRLARRPWPAGVHVGDFGIRGYDLAYALVAGHEYAILIDACPRQQPPGTVFVIEPDVDAEPPMLDPHSMDPLQVLRLARTLGELPGTVTIVGCQPKTLGPDEGQMGLSPEVAAAVDRAAVVIEMLIEKLLNDNGETGEPQCATV
jgi:hydrogenase maturation protease